MYTQRESIIQLYLYFSMPFDIFFRNKEGMKNIFHPFFFYAESTIHIILIQDVQ